jgi:hypothetical protein
MAALATTHVAIISPKATNNPILVSSIVLKTDAYPNELYQRRSVQTLVNIAKATIKTATMTNVGKMALRRRPTRRLLKLSSLLNRCYGVLVVSATTQPARAVPLVGDMP